MHAAARRPEVAAIGTPGPGCVLPPARYSPGSRLRDPGRVNEAFQPCEAGPYSAPPVAGNNWLNCAGVVITASPGVRVIARPARCRV